MRCLMSILLLLACTLLQAQELTVNAIFNSHMVLQRDVENRVWGRAAPGVKVTVQLAQLAATATTDDQGQWQVSLGALAAGGPYKMTIVASDQHIEFTDILMGDLWLCSGQSNMGWTVKSSKDPVKEAAAANWPQIRLFTVSRITKQTVQENVVGDWSVCTPETIPYFSAVAYYFGRHLHKNIQVPIGLINSSWGGTPAEAWTSRETLEGNEILSPITDRFAKSMENYDERAKTYLIQKKRYQEAQKKAKENGHGVHDTHPHPDNTGFEKGYAQIEFDDAAWEDVIVPHTWSELEDGVKWYRKTFDIPEAMRGQAAKVYLGPIDDFDVTYINNIKIGSTGTETPDFWSHKRVYDVEALPEQVTLSVRAFDHFGGGNFGRDAAGMFIESGGERLSLAGTWKVHTEHKLDPFVLRQIARPRAPVGPDHSHAPAGLYNAMIYPLMPLAIKGAIWYQGETNGGRGVQYRTLLPAMIKDWRAGFQSGDFPFFVVQLANWKEPQEHPHAGGWAELREAQLWTAQNDPHTGLAVTIDIGEANDIHPKNKQDVGKRLGIAAQHIAYGQDVVYSGPEYKSVVFENGQARLSFNHIGGGLVAQGSDSNSLHRFSIAGEDQKFYWAKAVIDGDTIVVSSDQVADPKAVRYGWEMNPEGCNLYNKEGLPASPFRTDDWPLSSDGRF